MSNALLNQHPAHESDKKHSSAQGVSRSPISLNQHKKARTSLRAPGNLPENGTTYDIVRDIS